MVFPTVTAHSAIRAGIALLAAFAFALSYDALRQMAVAIHIRGLLTYAFPLVIDGFIAIGVAALLMLGNAPRLSRAYVWALVGLATATSIWANALHAVRLNQQTRAGDGLRLDDVTVGVLSAIPPLALAGAVHLYIVIRRQPASHPQEVNTGNRQEALAHRHIGRDSVQPPTPTEDHPGVFAAPSPDSGDEVPAQTAPTPRRTGRPPNASLEELLAMARPVVERMGEVDRDAIAEEIRDVHGRKVSNGRLTKVTALLAEEHEAASASLLPSA
ncbi:DUF2637 domain-containing protein [Streptomyces sp. NBC_00827]|uniref:DUF2637 domain-containing protein n=1 Tax=Streptomyces sp. NBC_00827 TaxID=2903677 RepID=UPI0038674AEF|nr:DUF2637 domain-containing protein [Streptomyces sp. NBC_00827]